MKREEKIQEVEALKKKFQQAKAVIFAENKGLKVSQVTDLRKALQKEKASMQVVKNRLLKRALKEAKIDGLEPFIEGALTVTAAQADPVVIAKILAKFVKENEALIVKGGYLDGKPLVVEAIKALAALPSKEELYRMLLRCLTQPATQVVCVLAAVPRQLATVVNAIQEKKKQALRLGPSGPCSGQGG